MSGTVKDLRRTRGLRARSDGRAAEALVAAWLMCKGWRILGFRLKTPQGEIDLLAKRGRILAVIEVKSRSTLRRRSTRCARTSRRVCVARPRP